MRDATRGRLRWAPTGVVATWGISLALYDFGPPQVATAAMVPYLLVLVLGPSLVYPAARLGGAGVGASLALALLVPALWVAKECWAVGRLYSAGEALYYAFNPIALGLWAAAAVQIAIADLLLHHWREGRWVFRGGATLTLGLTAALALAFALAMRGHDLTEVFWTYVGIHRRLFGS